MPLSTSRTSTVRPPAGAALGRRDQGRDQRPLGVGEVAGIAQALALVRAPLLGRPHRAPPLVRQEPLTLQDCSRTSRTGSEIVPRNLSSSRISEGIRRADLIVADITGKNPNVFYELGIAH